MTTHGTRPATAPAPSAQSGHGGHVDLRARPARRSGSAGGRPRHPYAGSARLLRLALREDRLRIALWALGLTAMTLFTVPSVESAYGGDLGMQARAEFAGNPAAVLINGPTFAFGELSLGSMIASELGMMTFLAVGVMSILLVTRRTRAEEDSGRGDLVRSQAVGRLAPTVAALGTMTVASLAVATGVFLGVQGHGLPTLDAVAFAASIVAAGLVWGALGTVTAQVASHARSATGLALTALGLSYVLRGIGDVRDPVDGSALSWVSPLAWLQQMRPWVDLRWWPLGITLAATALLVVLASALGARRDLGSGLIAARPGRRHAGRWLSGPVGLAWHELQGDVLAWGAGLALFGGLFGVMTSTMVDALADVPMMKDWLALDPDALTDTLLASMLTYFTLGSGAFAVVATLHLRREEQAGTAAVAVVDGPGRMRWLGSWLLVVGASTVLVQVVGGAGLGVGVALDMGDWSSAPSLAVDSLAQVPGLLVFVGLTVALFGLAPRLVQLAWALVAWATFASIFGVLLELPEWAMNLSPVEAGPRVPYEALSATPMLVLAGIGIALGAVGVLAFRRRDLG